MFNTSTMTMLLTETWETLYMTVASTFLAYVIGLPLGTLLAVTDKNGIRPMPWFNKITGVIVNILRSVPFLILMITVMPVTRFIVGTTIGSGATIVPLVIAAAPFVARLVESSIKEVDQGVVEAAQSMGASNWQIITKVLLPEAKSPLLVGSAIAITTILGYSAMSGIVGGGGLGNVAIQHGYYRGETDLMLVTVIILVIIVQIFQEVGMKIANHCDKKL